MAVPKGKVLRAASYCRTSGEVQRDNTSIPRQQDANAKFIETSGWTLTSHYVDECKSGSKEEGREAFKRLMRDAANGVFDIVVVFDIKRFSRDGADIVRNSTFLRSNFSIHVVDTKGQFDTRDRRKTLINYVHAGVSEQERLDIMERMIGGRVRKAMDGLPWSGNRPFGRDFKSTGKNQGHWYVTERGKNLKKLLRRYVEGESLHDLAAQYGFTSASVVRNAFAKGQLSGPYEVTFNSPDLEMEDVKVPIPSMPEVISPDLERRVRERMQHNRNWNKQSLRRYVLSSFIYCERCGRALSGSTAKGIVYYKHHHGPNDGRCEFSHTPGALIEAHALDYLFGFFLDQPTFEEAIKGALPNDGDREALADDLTKAGQLLASVDKELANLVNAVKAGADPSLLIAEQDTLKTRRESMQRRVAELESSLACLPDPVVAKHQANAIRLQLFLQHQGKDWRSLSFDEVRRFLRFLFGDNTKASGNGIFVGRGQGRKWSLRFAGNVSFHHEVINGRPISAVLKSAAKQLSHEIVETYEKAVENAGWNADLDNSSARCSGGFREPL
jgi:site-specific DNA recombinase